MRGFFRLRYLSLQRLTNPTISLSDLAETDNFYDGLDTAISITADFANDGGGEQPPCPECVGAFSSAFNSAFG